MGGRYSICSSGGDGGGGRGGWGLGRDMGTAPEMGCSGGGPPTLPASGLESPMAIGIFLDGGLMGKFGGLYGDEVVVGSRRDSVLVGLCHDELSFTFFKSFDFDLF